MTRQYVSAKRQAQAAATREAILQAFVEQMSEPDWEALSPTEAAKRAGVSVRTVHGYFPNQRSQIDALAEWFDQRVFPGGVRVADGPDDLPRYFRDVHAMALSDPANRAYAAMIMKWPELRRQRRAARLDAVRRAVEAAGAPAAATEDATAILLSLSGADVSWPMHDQHGLPLDRIPDVIANAVRLIVDDLMAAAARAAS